MRDETCRKVLVINQTQLLFNYSIAHKDWNESSELAPLIMLTA